MFMRFSCAAALLFAALLPPGQAGAQNVELNREEIRNYDVRIEVERDGGVVVTEDIEVVALGYPRGVQRQLDRIEHEQPECAAWLTPMRALAQAFQFDRMHESIRDALANESRTSR